MSSHEEFLYKRIELLENELREANEDVVKAKFLLTKAWTSKDLGYDINQQIHDFLNKGKNETE
jgi:hypothetical protein